MAGNVISRLSEGAGKTSNLLEALSLHPELDPGLADCRACLSHKAAPPPLLTFSQACLSRGASCWGSGSLSQQGCHNILDGEEHWSRQCWHPVHTCLGTCPQAVTSIYLRVLSWGAPEAGGRGHWRTNVLFLSPQLGQL